MKCLTDLAKFYVFLVNLIATVFFGLVCSGVVYVLLRSKEVLGFHIEPNLSPENPSALHFSLILIIITLSGFFCLFTFLGCCGAACHNKCMLGSFVIILSIFALITTVAMACMFTYHHSEIDWMVSEAKKTILYYDPVDDQSIVRHAWDRAQAEWHCCGAYSFRDWARNEEIKPGRKIPASCCVNPDDVNDCVFEPEAGGAFVIGCIEKYQTNIRIGFWTIPFLIGTTFLAALFVYASLQDPMVERYPVRGHFDSRKVYMPASRDVCDSNTIQYYRAVPPPYSQHHRHYHP